MGSFSNIPYIFYNNWRLGYMSIVQLIQKDKGYSIVHYTDGSSEIIDCDYFGQATEIEGFIVFIREAKGGDIPVVYTRVGVIKKIEIVNGKV